MKLFIASDIHGSYAYADKLISLYKKSGAERLILLGDLLYHGPRNDLPLEYCPKKVIPLLSELKDEIIAVRGNCEAEVDQMVLPFSVMDTSTKLFVDNKVWFLTHGHIISYDNIPSGVDIFMQGHTHIPVLEKKDGKILLNPGSVSIPKDGSKNGYAFYEDGTLSLRDLDGNVLKTLEI